MATSSNIFGAVYVLLSCLIVFVVIVNVNKTQRMAMNRIETFCIRINGRRFDGHRKSIDLMVDVREDEATTVVVS